MNLPRFDINKIADWSRHHFGWFRLTRRAKINRDMARAGMSSETHVIACYVTSDHLVALERIAKSWHVDRRDIMAWAVRDYLERYTDTRKIQWIGRAARWKKPA